MKSFVRSQDEGLLMVLPQAARDAGRRRPAARGARVRQQPALHLQLGRCIEAGGSGGAVASLGDWLKHDPASPLRSHGVAGGDIGAVIDTRAVFQPGFRELDFAAMPPLLRPQVGRHGLCDCEKVFCADPKRGEDLFDSRGIDRDELAPYFAGILRVRS